MANQTKKEPISAAKRGLIGALAGEAVMIVILIIAAGSGTGVPLVMALGYLLLGPVYGFGFIFANWRIVLEKTKRGAIEGAAVFGIGVVLSWLTENSKWGIMGWIYFLLRVSWHIGMCWIPGIWYGIKLIRMEKKEQRQEESVRPDTARPPVRPGFAQSLSRPDAPQSQARPAQPVISRNLGASQGMACEVPKAAAPARSLQPVSPARPRLTGVTGLFAGVDFPIQPDEELVIGSDPSVCQIVLPPECAAPIHCSIRYDSRRGCWQARDLANGQTFTNGILALQTGVFEDVPKGRVICIGQGKTSQRFRLG